MADPTVPPTGAANEQYWIQHLTFRMSQEGGNELRSAIKRIAGDIRELEGGFDRLGGSVTNSLRTISNLAKAAFGAFGIYATANISNVVGELDKYNKALVALRPLTFQYGAGLDTLEKSVMAIGRSLKFTRDQMLSLSQSYLRGFNYAPVAKMSGYLHMAAMAAGENVESMQSYMQLMQGLGKQSAVFERVQLPGDQGEVKAGAIQGLTLAQAAVGKIDPSTYAQVAGYMEAIRKESMGIEDADTRRNRQMREQMETLRNVQKIWDDIKIAVAQQIMPLMTQFSRWLGSHHDGLVKIASQVIAIGKYVAIAGGAVAAFRVAKNILPGMATDRKEVTKQFGTFMAPTADTMSPKGAKAYASNLDEKRIKRRGGVSQVVSSALGTAQVGHPVPVTIVGISPGVSWGNNWGGTIGNAPTAPAGPAGPAFNPNTWQWQRGRTLGRVQGTLWTGRSHTTADRIAAIRAARGDFRAGTTFGRLGAPATRIGPEAFAISTKNAIGKALQYDVGRGAGQAMRAVGLGRLAAGGAAISGIAGKIGIATGEISGSVGRAGLGLGRGIAGVGKMAAGSLGTGITGAIVGRDLYEQYAPETFKRGFGSRGGGTMGEGLSSIAGGAAAGAMFGGPVGAAGGAIVGGAIESGRVFMEGQSIAADAMKAVDENRRKFEDYKKGAIDKAQSLGDTTRVTALEKQGQIREASDQADKMKSGFGYRMFGFGSDDIKKQEEAVQKLRREYQGWVDDQALSVTATKEQQDAAKNLRVQIEALIASTKKLESEGKTGPELAAAKAKLATRRDEYADIMAAGTKKDDQGRTVSALAAGGVTDKANKAIEAQNQKIQKQVEDAEKLLRISTAYLQYQKQIEEVMESQLRLLESQGTLFQQRQRFAGLAAISDPLGGLTEIKGNFESYMKQIDASEVATKDMIGTIESLSQIVRKQFEMPKINAEEARISKLTNEDERKKALEDLEKIKADRQKLINDINAMNITGPAGEQITGEKVLEDPEGRARIIAENALRERRNKLESELNNLAGKRLDASREYSKSLEPAIENQRLQVQQLSTINSLYENFGMGLSASISQRMQLIEAIGKENTLLQQQAGLNSERIEQFGKELQVALQVRSEIQRQADLSTGDDQLKFKTALLEADKKIDTIRGSQNQLLMDQRKIQNDILTNVTKQAEQAKVMREGYISAINAMNTGTGVFKKIVIDQNSQLGVLMRQFSGQVPMGVRTGQASPRFAGIGLQESSGFNVGGWYGPAQSLEENQSKLLNFPIPNIVNGLNPAQAQKAIYDITTRSQGASQETRAIMANRGGVSRLMDRTFPAESFGGMLEVIKKNEQVLKMLPAEMQSQVKMMMSGEQVEISPAQASASVKTVIETLRTLPANSQARENLPSLEAAYNNEMYTTNWYNQRSETMKTEIAAAMKAKSEAVQNVKVVNTDPIKVQVIQNVAAKTKTEPAAPQSPQGFEVSTPEGPGMQMPDGSIIVDTDNILQRNKGGTISFSDDGKIPGRGPNRDTVPAMLTKGEFVVNRDAVDHYGDGFLYALNNRSVPKNMLNVGGFVGTSSVSDNDPDVQRLESIGQMVHEIWQPVMKSYKDFADVTLGKDIEQIQETTAYQDELRAKTDARNIQRQVGFSHLLGEIKQGKPYTDDDLVTTGKMLIEEAQNPEKKEESRLKTLAIDDRKYDPNKLYGMPKAEFDALANSSNAEDVRKAYSIVTKYQLDVVSGRKLLDADMDKAGISAEYQVPHPDPKEAMLGKTVTVSRRYTKAPTDDLEPPEGASEAVREIYRSSQKARYDQYSAQQKRAAPGFNAMQPPQDATNAVKQIYDQSASSIMPPSRPKIEALERFSKGEVIYGERPADIPESSWNIMLQSQQSQMGPPAPAPKMQSIAQPRPAPRIEPGVEPDYVLPYETQEKITQINKQIREHRVREFGTGTRDKEGRVDSGLMGQIMREKDKGTRKYLVEQRKTIRQEVFDLEKQKKELQKETKIKSKTLLQREAFSEGMSDLLSLPQRAEAAAKNFIQNNADLPVRAKKFVGDAARQVAARRTLVSGIITSASDVTSAASRSVSAFVEPVLKFGKSIAETTHKNEEYEKQTNRIINLDSKGRLPENQFAAMRSALPPMYQEKVDAARRERRDERAERMFNRSHLGLQLNLGGGVDTQPAMLSPGEFVVKKDAVDTYGLKFMKHINEGKPIKRYADGGFVSPGIMQAPDQFSRENPLTGGSQVNSALKDITSKEKDKMSISTGKSNVSVEIELSQSQMRDMKDALVNDMTSLIDKAMKATESRLMSSLTGGA